MVLLMALERLHWNSTSNPNLLSAFPGDPGSIPAYIPSVFLLVFCACFQYFQTLPRQCGISTFTFINRTNTNTIRQHSKCWCTNTVDTVVLWKETTQLSWIDYNSVSWHSNKSPTGCIALRGLAVQRGMHLVIILLPLKEKCMYNSKGYLPTI